MANLKFNNVVTILSLVFISACNQSTSEQYLGQDEITPTPTAAPTPYPAPGASPTPSPSPSTSPTPVAGQGTILLVAEQGTSYNMVTDTDVALPFHVENIGNDPITVDSLPFTLPADVTGYLIDRNGAPGSKRSGPIQWTSTGFTHIKLNPGEKSFTFMFALKASKAMANRTVTFGAGASNSANKFSKISLSLTTTAPAGGQGNIVFVPEEGTLYEMATGTDLALAYHVENTGSQAITVDSLPISLPQGVTAYFIDHQGSPGSEKVGPIDWTYTQFGHMTLQPGERSVTFKFALRTSQKLSGASIKVGAGASNSGNKVSSLYVTIVNN